MLFHCLWMVAVTAAFKCATGSRTSLRLPGRRLIGIESRFTTSVIRSIAPKPTTRLAGKPAVNLSSIRSDIFITYWGSPWIAHPILSFHYGDDEYLAFSIEVRKEKGEGYSAVRGFSVSLS